MGDEAPGEKIKVMEPPCLLSSTLLTAAVKGFLPNCDTF